MPRYWRRATPVMTTIIKAAMNQGQLMPRFDRSSCCRMLPMYNDTIPPTVGAYRIKSQATNHPRRGCKLRLM